MIYDINGLPISYAYAVEGSVAISLYDINGDAISTEWNPVAIHGKLRKSGNNIVDKNGTEYQLRGIGTHAILQYTNLHTLPLFQCLKDNGINCVRISVYLSDRKFAHSDNITNLGYISHPTETKAEIEKIISLCVQLGMYCILDWHTMDYDVVNGVIQYQTEAVAFFDYFAGKYADIPNVLYELQNEPYNSSAESYASYVKAEHDKILEYVTNPIMIVGNKGGAMNQSENALISVGIDDVFYSGHFYADDMSIYQLLGWENNPYVASEWSNASEGSGATGDNPNVNGFMDLMYNKKVSNCAWKLTDQNHVFSVLKNRGAINSSYYSDGFTANDLTAWGALFFNNNIRYKQLNP